MIQRATMIGLSVLMSVGCDSSSTPAPSTPEAGGQSTGTAEITFYLPDMNRRLKIL